MRRESPSSDGDGNDYDMRKERLWSDANSGGGGDLLYGNGMSSSDLN